MRTKNSDSIWEGRAPKGAGSSFALTLGLGACVMVLSIHSAGAQPNYWHSDCWLRVQSGYPVSFQGSNPALAEIHAEMRNLATEYNVPVEIIASVCYQESGVYQYGGDGFLVHNLGECRKLYSGESSNAPPGLGLMQLTGDTAEQFDRNRLISDWKHNLRAGVEVVLGKYNHALSFDPPWMQDLETQHKNILENWFYALAFYNGYYPGNPYPYTIYALIASPPARIDGLFATVAVTWPETVVGGWSYGQPFVATPGDVWFSRDGSQHHGAVHPGTVPGPTGVWYVDASRAESGDGSSWVTAFNKIQDGINTASDGDTVMVAQGIYVENIHFNGENTVLRSTDPLNPDVVANTIIDGNQAGSVVTFVGTENEACVLSGFTIRNGKSQFGAGVCGATGPPGTRATIENNTIAGNSGGFAGGGLVWCDGAIRNNIITGNSAQTAAALADCNGTIERNVIAANSASSMGGGLGGCDGSIQNNTITQNAASLYGAALWGCCGTIQNNTIVGNRADIAPGLYQCKGTIHNCIIWGNRAANSMHQLGDSSVPLDSCIENWTGGGEGNIILDPRFVDPDGPDDDPETYEDNDYRLAPGSPCINAGLNEPWMWEAVDLDGNPRIAHGRVDIGAYEHGSTAFMLLRLVPAPGGGGELTWASDPEASYAVWSRANLSAGPWTLEFAVDSQGRLTRWTDPVTSARAKFYRVELR
ncbi:MAG: choice-of-anchor Q domain-containing protein [bacterium]|nr:choice-of-anchor Q domain-containing protein [bacterium]